MSQALYYWFTASEALQKETFAFYYSNSFTKRSVQALASI